MASSLPVLAVQKLRGSSKVFQGSITGGTCDSVPHWWPQWQNSSPCDLGGCFYRLQSWGSWKAESWKPASRRMRAARGEGMAAREESPGVLESLWPWRSVTLRVHGERLHDRGMLLRSGGTIRVRLYFPTDTKTASYTIICQLRQEIFYDILLYERALIQRSVWVFILLVTFKLHFPKHWHPENLIMQNCIPKMYAVYR